MGKLLTPPKSLGREGRRFWNAIIREYRITDSGGLELLRTAAECRDLECAAMATATAEGFSTVDRYGQKRPHPLLSVARDARRLKLSALKDLHLDVEPVRDRPGRPGGIG